jgi:hypothetical protein
MNTKNHIEFVDTSGTLPSFTFLQKVQFKHCDRANRCLPRLLTHS